MVSHLAINLQGFYASKYSYMKELPDELQLLIEEYRQLPSPGWEETRKLINIFSLLSNLLPIPLIALTQIELEEKKGHWCNP